MSGISIPKDVETRNSIGARPLRKQQRALPKMNNSNFRYGRYLLLPIFSPLLSHIVVTAHTVNHFSNGPIQSVANSNAP